MRFNKNSYEKIDYEGDLSIIPLIQRENEVSFNNAKNAVHSDHKKISFHQLELSQQLDVKTERGIQTKRKERSKSLNHVSKYNFILNHTFLGLNCRIII